MSNEMMACREMTAAEIAERLVGASKEEITQSLELMRARGFCDGRRSLESAVEHFEQAYRCAYGAQERMGNTGPDGETEAEYVRDAFEAARITAGIAYDEWRRNSPSNRMTVPAVQQ